MGKYLWILDNGHGENTPGKRSPKFDDGSQFFEWEFNRDIVNRITRLLSQESIDYHVLVPDKNDVSLKERIQKANTLVSEKKKLLVSVHANAAGMSSDWNAARGVITFYHKTSDNGKIIAGVFQEEIIKATGWNDRGTRYSVVVAGKEITLAITRDTAMPAILTENGFFTNKEECTLLMQEETRQKIAQAHADAIKKLETSLNY